MLLLLVCAMIAVERLDRIGFVCDSAAIRGSVGQCTEGTYRTVFQQV